MKKFSYGKWVYTLVQDEDTGELTVLDKHIYSSPLQKAVEYVKAEASVALAEPLRLPVVEGRKAACFGCDSMEQYDGHMYCKACGCPRWERSRLEVKWEMPGAKCTLGKWPE